MGFKSDLWSTSNGDDAPSGGKSNSVTTQTIDSKQEQIASSKKEVGSESPESETKEREAQARNLIQDCIAHYRSLKSYEDNAFIRIRIPYSTDPYALDIPWRVAWERPNKLALRMNRLEACWTPDTFEANFGQVGNPLYPDQRVVRPLPNEISKYWLLIGNLERQLIDERFGLPVTVESLLNDDGIEGSLANTLKEADARWLKPDTIDGVVCERIQLTKKELTWVVWIDAANRLILRQEYPHVLLYAAGLPIPANLDPSKILCQVEYENIKTNHTIDWTPWGISRSTTEVLLRNFVSVPDRNIPPKLGTRLAPFTLQDTNGSEFFDFAERKKNVTVFHIIDDSETSRAYVDEVYSLRRKLRELGLDDSYESILVSSRPGDRMAVVMKSWNCTLPLGIDPRNQFAIQCGVSRTPATIIVGKDGRIQHISEMSGLNSWLATIPELIRGVDVAYRDLTIVTENEARYASQLHRHAISKEEILKLSEDYREIAKFPFFFHDIKLNWRTRMDEGIVAAVGETYLASDETKGTPSLDLFGESSTSKRVMTVLDEIGNIYSIDQFGEGKLVSKIPVENTVNAKRFWIYPDPWNHEFVYVVPDGLPRFWYFVAPTGSGNDWKAVEADQYGVDDGESIVSGVWLLTGNKSAFCLITSQSRVIAIDPNTQEAQVAIQPDKRKAALQGIVPKLNKKGLIQGWAAVRDSGDMEYVETTQDVSQLSVLTPLELAPQSGNWLWGMGPNGPLFVGLCKLPAGSVGSITMDESFRSLYQKSLATRPEQCRLLSAMTNKKSHFYCLLSAPNRVLHLETVGGPYADQMSFGARVYGAAIYPDGDNIKLIVALDREVSCWTVSSKQ